jgi:hypothetical protein
MEKTHLATVTDIRIARVKKLARAFFNDLSAPVLDQDVVPLAFEFVETLRTSGQIPTPHVKGVLTRHTDLIDLLDTLRRERVKRQNRG